jgi:hypothetical protein
MYLIARPGPYINAETTGGGTPGWGIRIPGAWRTFNKTYINAMEGYVRTISRILAPAQITNGGPVTLVQPENEYSYCLNIPNCTMPWPQQQYMQVLQDMMRGLLFLLSRKYGNGLQQARLKSTNPGSIQDRCLDHQGSILARFWLDPGIDP